MRASLGISAVLALGVCLAAAEAARAGGPGPGRGAEGGGGGRGGRGRLGARFQEVADAHERGGALAARRLAAELGLKPRSGEGGRPLLPVILEPASGDASSIDRDALARIDVRVDAVSRSFMRVLAPLPSLRALAGLPGVRVARPATPAKALAGFGTVVSESAGLTGAAALQVAGNLGAGVPVAVVDLGFVGFASAKAAGELPATAVGVDLSGTGLESDTEHGVGVAEHVLDMAPGVALTCIKVGDEVDLENAATYIRDHGIRIANHSVGWVISSYYDDSGPINGIINASRDTDGVFWTVAAGNDAQGHWRGGWSDPDADGVLNFTATDESIDLTSASGSVAIFLNWDQYGSSLTDLDLYVRSRNGQVVAASEGWQNGPQDPSEAVSFAYNPVRAPYRIEVRLFAGPTAGLDMTIFSFYNDLEHAVAASSLADPADAHGAFTVGAIDQADWNDAAPLPEPFSSQGPTNDGRRKPDIASPDGTSSLTYGPLGSYGTSFSAPTVAGAAALLLGEDPTRTADDLAARLAALALDIGAAGPDDVFGAGKLNLLSAEEHVTSLGPIWISGDTRAHGTVNGGGTSQLVSGRSALEDERITERLSFVAGPSGAAGSIRFASALSGDKATLEDRAFEADPFDPALRFEYRWYRTSGGVAAPALKLGLDTAEANPTSALAIERGEDRFDKILVYEPYLQRATSDGTWTTETIDAASGRFWLVNLTAGSAAPATNLAVTRTLAEWAAVFGAAGLDPNAVSLQLGVGSGNPGQVSHVEYVEWSGGPGTLGKRWSFYPAP
jgi:hypothetical protein